ncbi:MAG TPA: heme o synthase [Acidimicrobiia bacterium]|nr:heme o synthase [Acidimicrobiia bacterium]
MDSPSVSFTDPDAHRSGWRDIIGAYIGLTKPRIIELLLITTVPAMVLAARGWPGTWLVFATLIGGTLSAGGANTLNNYIDRDIDRQMKRTSRRPLPRHRVDPHSALWFGIVLGVAGFFVLWATSNLLAASISTAALLFYVFVYSLTLKRMTPQNIVIGGAAGAAPVLVGWAAVTGTLDLSAWILFAIVFYWTPPHFWALALRYRDDYAAVEVPMLPVIVGPRKTAQQIIAYSAVLVFVTFWLVPVAELGWIYTASAGVLGAWMLFDSVRLLQKPETAMNLFRTSTIYLSLLFAAVWIDVVV